MVFAQPKFSRGDVNRAGSILAAGFTEAADVDGMSLWLWAHDVLANWRACHGYPMNTFQATLRGKVAKIDSKAIVAQRLKRSPSVVSKLERFKTMNLSQMQDIGGLRAVVRGLPMVRKLEADYRSANFPHVLVTSKDYITRPKNDGYRSVHIVYRYVNPRAPAYDGLHLELQLRTRTQHAWATAVETMGTFLGQALKSGQGERRWREFFECASAAITHLENAPPVPGYETAQRKDVFAQVAKLAKNLNILQRLSGFTIAANRITSQKGVGRYHLVVLDSVNRSVSIRPFATTQLELANAEYGKIEERARQGEQIEAVLVSAGPVEALRKAYPNFFLDTHSFVATIQLVIAESAGLPVAEVRRVW